jgi:hypothetical protein
MKLGYLVAGKPLAAKRSFKLIMPKALGLSITENNRREPICQLRKHDNRKEPKELQNDKWNNAPVYVSCRDLRRGDGLEVKQGKTKRRRKEGGLQIDGKEDAEPGRIETELYHDGGQDRYMNKSDLYEVEEKSYKKDKAHHDCKDRLLAVGM